MCWKKAALVRGMFSEVAEPWVKSCFLASSTLLRVHFLLYMMMRNLSSSVMLCGSTSSGCKDRVMKAPVTAGQAVHADQADFFPSLRKLDTVSHLLISWNIIIANSLQAETSKAMMIFHEISRCDTVSSFLREGKKSAWSAWTACPAVTGAFMTLSLQPEEVYPQSMTDRLQTACKLRHQRQSHGWVCDGSGWLHQSLLKALQCANHGSGRQIWWPDQSHLCGLLLSLSHALCNVGVSECLLPHEYTVEDFQWHPTHNLPPWWHSHPVY